MVTSTLKTLQGDGTRLPGAPPDKIGKYELRGELGRGACGVVYKGFDSFVQRDVAVKVALQKHGAGHGEPELEEAERNFFAEARAAGMLQHPHIVGLYDAGVEGDLSYLVMEYVDGETLLPLCRPDSPRPPLDRVVDIIFKCARALDYSHGKGVLHRDIKPSNIMLTRDGVPKIMDFSIAEIGPQTQRTGLVQGSPQYMSPEQVRGAPLGSQTDLYSLGAVLFQMLAGQPPFPIQDIPQLFTAIKTQPAPSLATLRPDLPPALCKVVERLLLKDPAQRFQSGQELASALTRIFDRLRLEDKQLTSREDRDALQRLHFFDSFSDDEVDEIINAATMATYQSGDTIIREGEIDTAFYIIAVGSAEVRKGGKVITRLEKGDCLGEVAFIGASKRSATVTAITRVLALKIHATTLNDLSRDCQLRFFRVLCETLIFRLSMTSARLSALS